MTKNWNTPEVEESVMALLRLDVETPITQIVAAINKEHGLSVSKDQMQKRVKSLRPRLALEQGKIQRATSSPVSYLDRLAVPAFAGGSVVAFMGDTQFPYEDPAAWALTLAWVAIVQTRRPPDNRRSYGYHRLEVVSALLNGGILQTVLRDLNSR